MVLFSTSFVAVSTTTQQVYLGCVRAGTPVIYYSRGNLTVFQVG